MTPTILYLRFPSLFLTILRFRLSFYLEYKTFPEYFYFENPGVFF